MTLAQQQQKKPRVRSIAHLQKDAKGRRSLSGLPTMEATGCLPAELREYEDPLSRKIPNPSPDHLLPVTGYGTSCHSFPFKKTNSTLFSEFS